MTPADATDGARTEDDVPLPDDEVAEAHEAVPRRRRSGAAPAPVATPSRGRRTASRKAAKKRGRRRRVLQGIGVLAGVGVLVPVGWGIAQLVSGDDATVEAAPTEAVPVVAAPGTDGIDPQPTLLFATVDEAQPQAGATGLALLGWDRASESSTLMLIPATTVADIPGRGLLQLGVSQGLGDSPLLDTSVDNLLGIDVDHVVTVSEQGWQAVFTRMDGLTLTLPERLRNIDGEIRFQAGEQALDGPRVGELLTLVQPNEAELSRLPRTQLVFETMLDAISADPSLLDQVFADGAPMLDTTADSDGVRELLAAAAESRATAKFLTVTLPVDPRGSGVNASYEIDAARAQAVIDERFSASVPAGVTATATRRLQVLNGNGRPGMGQSVAETLIPLGFRVVLTGNADSFDYAVTQVVVYRDDAEVLAAAEAIVEALGVGSIVLSDTPQSVVDITIVVGADLG